MMHLVQIDGEIREANDQEIADIDARNQATLDVYAEIQRKATVRAEALTKLGLTDDEIKALFG